MTELIIVGGGVAACSAGIFAGRRGIKTLIIAKDIGGQTASTSEIENYPGVGCIEGPRLIEIFVEQARAVGCTIIIDEVKNLSQAEDKYCVSTTQNSYTADTLLLAFGKTPKNLEVANEDYFVGKGLHYCNSYEVEHYRDKTIAIVGGGNSALELVWKFSTIARRIYLFHRREEFRGERILLDRLGTVVQCEKKVNTIITKLHGDKHLTALTVTDTQTNTNKYIEVDGLFVAIGFEARSHFIEDFVLCDSSGKIQVDSCCATNREGVFAAGDITNSPYQQIVIAAGDGAKAAISAYQYIAKKNGKRALHVDWGIIR